MCAAPGAPNGARNLKASARHKQSAQNDLSGSAFAPRDTLHVHTPRFNYVGLARILAAPPKRPHHTTCRSLCPIRCDRLPARFASPVGFRITLSHLTSVSLFDEPWVRLGGGAELERRGAVCAWALSDNKVSQASLFRPTPSRHFSGLRGMGPQAPNLVESRSRRRDEAELSMLLAGLLGPRLSSCFCSSAC